MPIDATSCAGLTLRPIYQDSEDPSGQYAIGHCHGSERDILISSPYTDVFGQSIQQLSMPLQLGDEEMPSFFFRELLEDPTNRGIGHWVAIPVLQQRYPVILYIMTIPANLPPELLEGSLRTFEQAIGKFYDGMALRHAA